MVLQQRNRVNSSVFLMLCVAVVLMYGCTRYVDVNPSRMPPSRIAFTLDSSAVIGFEIFEIDGEKVRTILPDIFSAGFHYIDVLSLDDDSLPLSKGYYFYRQIPNGELNTSSLQTLWLDGRIIYEPIIPSSAYIIDSAYPNPFSPNTNLSFELDHAMVVRIKIYNIEGKVVMKFPPKALSAGWHRIPIDATDLVAGMYFYNITSEDGFNTTGKMVLLK